MDYRYQKTIEWFDSVALTSGESRTLVLAHPGHLHATAHMSGRSRITWYIITELAARFEIIGALNYTFGPTDIILTQVLTPASLNTPYELPPPRNQTGWLVVTAPFIRLRLVDTAAAGHAYTRFYAKAW